MGGKSEGCICIRDNGPTSVPRIEHPRRRVPAFRKLRWVALAICFGCAVLGSGQPGFTQTRAAALPDVRSSASAPAAVAESPVAKVAAPSAEEQKQAEERIREVLSAEFAAAKTPAQKVALASRLISLALETDDDPAARYMLAVLARDLATDSGDITRAWEAITVIDRFFVVDTCRLKAELFERLLKELRSVGPTESVLTFLEGTIVAAREAALNGKSESASRLLTVAQTLAKRLEVAPIRQEVTHHVKAVEGLLAAWKSFEDSRTRLQLNPADASARTAVGLWLCLIKNDPAGLEHLAGGDQPALAALAALELKLAQAGGDPLPLAEGWFQEAEKLPSPHRLGALLRARSLYEAIGMPDPELAKKWQPRLDLALQAELALYPFQYGVIAEGNVASAQAGAQAVGRGASPGLIDGVIPPVVGPQGMAIAPWPCEWTVILPEIYRLREIRLKLPDPGKTVQFFVLSISPDGRNFHVLADHSKVPSAGWQRFVFLAKPVKAIRIQGISHSGDQNFYASELEAYCSSPAPWVVRGTTTGRGVIRPRRPLRGLQSVGE